MSALTRRDFLATASAATLSALAAGFPRRVDAAAAGTLVPTADAVIVLWMAGGMAHTETFDPKRYTPFEAGLEARQGAQHVPGDRHGGGPHQDLAGAGEHRRGDGPRHADSLVHGRRPRLHPALAAPVPVAHRLRAAADRGRAAPRRGHRAHARPEGPGDAGVHQHRPAARRRRRRGAEGVHDGRLPRQRVRPVQRPVSRRGRRRRPPAGRHDAGTLRAPRPLLPEAARRQPHRRSRQRLSAGIAAPRVRQRAPPAQLAGREGIRPVARAAGARPQVRAWLRARPAVPRRAGSLRRQVRAADGRPLRPRLPARAPAGRSRARASSK